MPCNNTSMMLPLAMENSANHGGGGALQLPLIQPHSPNGKAAPNSPPMRNLSTPISMSNAAVTAAQNAVNQAQQNQQSSRYKTELCRPFEEFNVCKYGDKCQFAHGFGELRRMTRHPKYKTELCRTFHTLGLCPYGHRCHFIHNSEEAAVAQGRDGGNAGQQMNGTGPAVKESVTHRSSSMSSSASTSSSSSSTSGLGSGGSSPVYHPNPHTGSPFSAVGSGLGGLGSEADLYAAAGLQFGPLAVQAQLVAAAQAQLALNVAAQQAQLPPLSPSQSPTFCGSSIPSLSSSPPLSATSATSPGIYAPINFYMETNHRLPVFWNLSP